MRLAPCFVACWLAVSLCTAQQPNSPQPTEPTVRADGSPVEGSTAPHPGGNLALPVPEPSTLFLVGTGLVGVALTARRRRRTKG